MAHLQVEQLSISFGGLKAVNDVSFAVEEGAIHGLIGPNGAGKTTIFNCISGVYKPNHGSIRFAGHDLALLKPHQVAQCGIARTFQNIELFRNMTVLDNLLVGQHTHLRCGIFASAWPCHGDGAKPRRVARGCGRLCSFWGWRRCSIISPRRCRLGIRSSSNLAARAGPGAQLLLLDEPASGMNPQETAALRLLIEDIRRRLGITVLLVEHDMGLVMKVCDRISVLNFGVKIAEGTPRDIQHNPEVIEVSGGGDKRC